MPRLASPGLLLAAAPGALYVTRQGIGQDASTVLRSADGGDTWTEP